MIDINSIHTIYAELEVGTQLPKCLKCGCMKMTLDNFAACLPNIDANEARALLQTTLAWQRQTQPVQYHCLGCEHCYPAAAQYAFITAFPSIEEALVLDCDFQVSDDRWPPVVGEYFVLDQTGPVVVSTLANVQLAKELADRQPPGLALAGKTETENIGIDKIIKNVVANSSIQYLIIAGHDSKGHQSGKTLAALVENGVNSDGRVIDSPSRRAFLRNVTLEEIETFRRQVQLVDMRGCNDPDEIKVRIGALAAKARPVCGGGHCNGTQAAASSPTVPPITTAHTNGTVTLDKAGYFVITPVADKNLINVEHYSYDNKLLRTIQGQEAKSLYKTIIDNGWVTELSHAAYLGRELAKAEMSLEYDFKFVQDGA